MSSTSKGENVRLGIAGLGWWGRVLADSVNRSGAAEVVSCFARTESTRAEFAADYSCRAASSLDELLADDEVEGVVYATPHTLHREHIEQAAAAGVHVLVEKPFTMSSGDGVAAIAAASDANVQLMVGHQRRRQAANRRIRSMVDDGSIGTILHAETSFFVPMGFPDSWRADRSETPLGGMTGLGVHHLDTLHYLIGPVRRVTAFSNSVLPDEALDHATGVLLEFETGAVATLITSHFVGKGNRVALHGSSGSAINEQDGDRLFVQPRTEPTSSEVEFENNDPLAEQMAEFASAIRGTATVETSGAEGLAVIQVLEAAIASADRGEVVDVDEFR